MSPTKETNKIPLPLMSKISPSNSMRTIYFEQTEEGFLSNN
jgi:hypothetical protein